MKQEISGNHKQDEQGNPAGGFTEGRGIRIDWQDGPIPRDESGQPMQSPNGAFVEGVIAAAIDRLKFYEKSNFACSYNREAIDHLEQALVRMEARTTDRLERKVEGEHKV